MQNSDNPSFADLGSRGRGRVARIIAAMGALAVVVSTAAAQTAFPDDGRFQVEWEQTPTVRHFVSYYPRKAASRGASGIAVLCCTPRDDRSMSCRVGREWPDELDFGAAAVVLAREFRMTQASFDAFHATPEAWIQIPIRFRYGSPRDEERLDAIAEETRGFCRPGRGPIIVTP